MLFTTDDIAPYSGKYNVIADTETIGTISLQQGSLFPPCAHPSHLYEGAEL